MILRKGLALMKGRFVLRIYWCLRLFCERGHEKHDMRMRMTGLPKCIGLPIGTFVNQAYHMS